MAVAPMGTKCKGEAPHMREEWCMMSDANAWRGGGNMNKGATKHEEEPLTTIGSHHQMTHHPPPS